MRESQQPGQVPAWSLCGEINTHTQASSAFLLNERTLAWDTGSKINRKRNSEEPQTMLEAEKDSKKSTVMSSEILEKKEIAPTKQEQNAIQKKSTERSRENTLAIWKDDSSNEKLYSRIGR